MVNPIDIIRRMYFMGIQRKILLTPNPDLSEVKYFRLGHAPLPAEHVVWPIDKIANLYYIHDVINGVRIISINTETQNSVIWDSESSPLRPQLKLGDYVTFHIDGIYWEKLPKPDVGIDTFMYHGWYNVKAKFNIEFDELLHAILETKVILKHLDHKVYVTEMTYGKKPSAYMYAQPIGQYDSNGCVKYDVKYAGFSKNCWVKKATEEMVHFLLKVPKPLTRLDEYDQLIIY
jgi:hypothetical protein